MKKENCKKPPYRCGYAPLAPDPEEEWEDPLWLFELDVDRGLRVVDELLISPSRVGFWTSYIEALRALEPDAGDPPAVEVVPEKAFEAIVENGVAAAVTDGTASLPLVEGLLRSPRELLRLHRAVMSEPNSFYNVAAVGLDATVVRTRGDDIVASLRTPSAAIDPEVFKLHAELCQALASARRLEIIYYLSQGPQSAGELRALLRMSKSSLSQHTALLAARGLIRSAPRGKMVVYEIAGDGVNELLQAILRLNRRIIERRDIPRVTTFVGSQTI